MSLWNKIGQGYLIVVAFLMLSAYNFYSERILEGLLYFLVAAGFTLMGMVRSKKYEPYKKFLNIASWIAIIAAVILFLVVLRMDAYGW